MTPPSPEHCSLAPFGPLRTDVFPDLVLIYFTDTARSVWQQRGQDEHEEGDCDRDEGVGAVGGSAAVDE
jgi:hypothetical protein